MMREMPFTLADPVEHDNPYGFCFDMQKCPACLESIQRKDNPKHLSDAELAAEYYRLKADLCSFARITDSPLEIDRKASILFRFAATPHVHQEDS